jgi:hypothetical protein
VTETPARPSWATRPLDQFADRATIPTFLPLTAERFARQRLRALAKIEGLHDDGKPTVLFLCVHNAGRSQMAMGSFSHLSGEAAVAWSGGSEPGTQVNPAAVEAMRERGIDISAEFPKPWTDETVRALRDDIERRVRRLLDQLTVPART